jgi:hypothetical protein
LSVCVRLATHPQDPHALPYPRLSERLIEGGKLLEWLLPRFIVQFVGTVIG